MRASPAANHPARTRELSGLRALPRDSLHKRVEVAEPVYRMRKNCVAFRSARGPRLQSLEVKQKPNLRIGIRHFEQELTEPCCFGCGRTVENGKVAVIVYRCLRQ